RATAAPFETLRGPGPAALRPSTESARPRAQKPTPFPGRPDHSARGLRSNTSAAGDRRAPTFNGECPSSGTETHVLSGPPRTFCPTSPFERFCGRGPPRSDLQRRGPVLGHRNPRRFGAAPNILPAHTVLTPRRPAG